VAKASFLEKLAKAKVLEWTTDPALTPEDSLRRDKVFGVTSVADLDRATLRRRAEATSAKSGPAK
jgi:hypothetical protein